MFLNGRSINANTKPETPSVNAVAMFHGMAVPSNHGGAARGEQLQPVDTGAPEKQNLLRQPVLTGLTP